MHLTVFTRRCLANNVENIGREYIPADDRKIGRRVLCGGFFDHLIDSVQTITHRFTGNNTVSADLILRHFHHCHNRAAELVIEFGHLLKDAWPLLIDAKVIGKHHAKRLVANQRLSRQNRVAQAFHLALADHGKNTLVNDATNALEILFFRGARNLVLQLVGNIEMISDGSLPAPRHERAVFHPRRQRLFHSVLKQRFVHDRQHFLSRAFCCGQKPRSITRYRE